MTSPPARRTDGSSGWRIDSVDVFVLIAFVVDFFPRDALPDFDTSVTPERRDPAKMKWMFKEDHSLGKKKGAPGCYETTDQALSRRAVKPSLSPSLSLFLHPRSVVFFPSPCGRFMYF